MNTSDRPTVPDAPVGRRRRPGRARPAAPAARVSTGRVAESSHRNPAWVLGGLLLVLVSALGGMLLFTAGDERTDVLVAAGDLERGHIVQRSDLRVRRIAIDGVDVVTPDELDRLLGQQTIGPVPAGALLHPGMFSAESPIGPDEMVIGAALDPGEFPVSRIPLGVAVELLIVTTPDAMPAGAPAVEPAAGDTTPPAATGSVPADGAAAGDLSTVRPIGRGIVVVVEERASGQLLVTVLVRREVGLLAAQAAADDSLRLAIVGDDT